MTTSQAASPRVSLAPSSRSQAREASLPSPQATPDSIALVFDHLEQQLNHLRQSLMTDQATSEAQARLRQLVHMVQRAHEAERTRLAHLIQRLHTRSSSPHRLYAEIVQRYHEQMTSLLTRLEALLEEMGRSGDHASASQTWLSQLEALQQQVRSQHFLRTPLRLDRFPHQAKSLKSPRLVERPKKASGAPPPEAGEGTIQVALLGDLMTLVGQVPSGTSPPPPTDADLAEDGLEIVFTPRLRALAAQLDFEPIKIFEFVLNEIAYEPYDGSLKGADRTLAERAGNDVDIVSLLIALFRISGFPARYVLGEVEVSARQALRWLKVFDLMTAGQMLASNDVPVTVILEEGQPVALQTFHIWVEVYLPFAFYRGLWLPGSGESPKRWSPLDASFKPHQFQPGADLLSQAGIDLTQAQVALAQAVETDAAGSVIAFQEVAVETLVRRVYDRVREITPPSSPLQDGRGRWNLVEQRHGILPATINFRVLRRDRRTAVLDHALRHHVRVMISYWPYNLAIDESQGGLDLGEIDFLAPTVHLVGKRLTLSYYPATPEDQAVIDEFGGRLAVPPYLVRMRPQLLLDGQRVGEKRVDDITMGLPEHLWYQHIPPGQLQGKIVENIVMAGSSYAIGLNVGRVSAEEVQERLRALRERLQALPPPRSETDLLTDEILGASLEIAILAYWAELDFLNTVAADPGRLHLQRLPSIGLAGKEFAFTTIFGNIPLAVNGLFSSLDIDQDDLLVISKTGNLEEARSVALLVGLRASAMEAAIGEQFGEQLTRLPDAELTALVARTGISVTELPRLPTSVSAVSVLLQSAEAGIPVHLLNGANSSALLPRLAHREEVITTVTNAVAAGLVVLIPERELTILDWHGTGYLIIDPATGALHSPLSSGRNGAEGTIRLKVSLTQPLVDGSWEEPLERDIILNTLSMLSQKGDTFVARVPDVGLEGLGVGTAAMGALQMQHALAQQEGLNHARRLMEQSGLVEAMIKRVLAFTPRLFTVGAPLTLTLQLEGATSPSTIVRFANQVIAQGMGSTVVFTPGEVGPYVIRIFGTVNGARRLIDEFTIVTGSLAEQACTGASDPPSPILLGVQTPQRVSLTFMPSGAGDLIGEWSGDNGIVKISRHNGEVTLEGVAPGQATLLSPRYRIPIQGQPDVTCVATVAVTVIQVEIFEVTTPSDLSQIPGDNSFISTDIIELRARVIGDPTRNHEIDWVVIGVNMGNADSGTGNPATAQNADTFRFRPNPGPRPTTGTRQPNDPLGYNVRASLSPTIFDEVPPLAPISQDIRDRIRQEYEDFRRLGNRFFPGRTDIQEPLIISDLGYNGGNYSFMINGILPGLELELVNQLNFLLSTPDISRIQPCPCAPDDQPCLTTFGSQCRLNPLDVVIQAGTIGRTSRPANPTFDRNVIIFHSVPGGDDVYCDPTTGRTSRTAVVGGFICAGPNGRAETIANIIVFRTFTIDDTDVSSGYRNPRRNVDVGSRDSNSLHTRGRALDISSRNFTIPGLISANPNCVLELAGDRVVGGRDAFMEQGPRVRPCDSPDIDHLHMQQGE